MRILFFFFYCLFAFALVIMKIAQVGVVADWSWTAVMAPVWTPAVLCGVCVGLVFAGQFFRWLADKIAGRNQRGF